MTAAIEVKELRKSFENLDVIKGLNMSVSTNEIYGFLGANGAGKTTVFKMMTGLLKKDSGSLHILGKDTQTHRNEILRNMGMSIETPIFYEHLSAQENLSIHLAYMDAESNIHKALTMVGLAIARAMIHNPKILILDEPFNGLDPQGIRDMRTLFKCLCEEHGKTILLSSHTLS